MDVERQDEVDRRVERLLVESRPRPDAVFTDSLERRLLPSRPRPRRFRPRPLWVGAAAATGLAGAAVVFSLGGGGPLAPGGGDEVEAGDDCRYVTVERRVRKPTIVTGTDGRETIRYRTEVVERRVRRCR